MSIDMTKIKRRLEKLQEKSEVSKQNLWKPSGKTRIRIVPYKFDRSNPFQELYFHYRLGGKNYLSPTTYGEKDPINEFAQEMIERSRVTQDKMDWKLGKKLEPKLRTYVPVVVRGEEDQGVKFWGFGKRIYEELLKIIADPDYGDITDAMTGRDIEVDHKTPKEAGNDYGSTTILVKPNRVPITNDPNLMKKILDEQEDIVKVYKSMQGATYEQLEEVLEKYLNPENVEDEEEKSEQSTVEQVTQTETKSVSDIVSEFQNMLDE